MKHTEWKQYMHETAERCRRQIVVELRARAHIRPRAVGMRPELGADYSSGVEAFVKSDIYATAMEVAGRSLDWFENTTRNGCAEDQS